MKLITLFISLLAADSPVFLDRAQQAGLDFHHFNGMVGKVYFPEMMGAGAALLDYDRDGDLDVFLVQGRLLAPEDRLEQALAAPRSPLSDRLFRNDSENGRLRFTDVTAASGIMAVGYGMGVSVGDIDSDGWPDLYLSNFGANQLWRNRGDGSFQDVTDASGAGDDRWTVTAVFFDYDGDGWQDLYLVNYVDYRIATAKVCLSHNDTPDYCSPQSYQPAADRLLHNRGNGTYQVATTRAGMAAQGPGLGAVSGDFNGDGRIDLYVANDGAANFLWINQGDGRFLDDALMAGVAVNMAGMPEASMGVDAGDHDGDGDLDLFMTHLDRQTNTLYVNDGKGWFNDRSLGSVLGSSSFAYTGFGTAWFDFDNDGWLDLMSANGAVARIEAQANAGDPLPLKQRNQLWRNLGGDQGYADMSSEAGPAFNALRVSRGAAIGDIDNDGDSDILLTNNSGPAELLVNQTAGRHWIGVVPRTANGAIAVGTTVTVEQGKRRMVRRSRTDGGYLSAHDPRVLVGLASDSAPVTVTVRWPSGAVTKLTDLATDRYHEISARTASPPQLQEQSVP